MESRVLIRTFGFSPLEVCGLRKLVEQMGCGLSGETDTAEFSFDRNTVYVVEIHEFLNHIDHYLPRKESVLVMSRNDDVCAEGISAVSLSAPIEKIREKLHRLIKTKESVLSAEEKSAGLTARETEVLRHLAQGKTNKEIASTLFISINTVLTHRKNISAKLNIRSVSGLSLYAMMNGLI